MIVAGHGSQRRVAPWTGRAGPAAAFWAQRFAQRFSQKHGQRQRSPGPCVSVRVGENGSRCGCSGLISHYLYLFFSSSKVQLSLFDSHLASWACRQYGAQPRSLVRRDSRSPR